MLQPSPAFLHDRRRQGNDIRDEVWDGELHVVPPASPMHQRFGKKLLAFLDPIAAARGFELAYETGLYVLRGERYAVAPIDGVTHARALETIQGPQLRVAAGDVSTTI